MYEPNEPHDEWGRPLKEPETTFSLFSAVRDKFFFFAVGLVFLLVFGWILILFLPYYMGRNIWERFEIWYINK